MTYTPHPSRRQRKRTRGFRMEPGGVYVGRPSIWGSPYIVDIDARGFWIVRSADGSVLVRRYSTRIAAAEGSVRLFRTYLANKGDKPGQIRDCGGSFIALRAASELHGRLAYCWCPLDEPCHGDVLCEIAEGGK